MEIKYTKEKETALAELHEIKETQRKQEVESAKAAAETIRLAQISELQKQHKQSLIDAEAILKLETLKIDERNSVIETLQRKRELLYDELVKVHADYQDFINKHPLFDPGQTDYLLHDFKANIRIENPYTDTTATKYSNATK